jgi:hypothetical protein
LLAQKVFSEGCEKGLEDIHAIATAGEQVAATVWFAKLAGEDRFRVGMRDEIVYCSIRYLGLNRKPSAVVGSFVFCRGFRHYQSFEWMVSHQTVGRRIEQIVGRRAAGACFLRRFCKSKLTLRAAASTVWADETHVVHTYSKLRR